MSMDSRNNDAAKFDNIIGDLVSSDATRDQAIKIYEKWATDYDKDIKTHYQYAAPKVAAKTLSSLLGDRKDAKILDLGAGTGLVAEELLELGFTNIDAIDASAEMLEIAKGKNLYKRLIRDFLGPNRLDIENNTYDGMLLAGTFVPNHANDSCFEELIRICKPGGYIVITMSQRHLTAPDFKDRLEPRILQIEEAGQWKWLERKLHENYRKALNEQITKRTTRGVSYSMQKEDE